MDKTLTKYPGITKKMVKDQREMYHRMLKYIGENIDRALDDIEKDYWPWYTLGYIPTEIELLQLEVKNNLSKERVEKCAYCGLEFKGMFSHKLLSSHEVGEHPQESELVASIIMGVITAGVVKAIDNMVKK